MKNTKYKRMQLRVIAMGPFVFVWSIMTSTSAFKACNSVRTTLITTNELTTESLK